MKVLLVVMLGILLATDCWVAAAPGHINQSIVK